MLLILYRLTGVGSGWVARIRDCAAKAAVLAAPQTIPFIPEVSLCSSAYRSLGEEDGTKANEEDYSALNQSSESSVRPEGLYSAPAQPV